MPVWWCPRFKLCPWFLKVHTEELLQFGQGDRHIWSFVWKLLKSWQYNIYRKQQQHHNWVNQKLNELEITDLPGFAFSFISTKYLSSSNSLALCIWSSMGPVQYIWLKWIKSCVLLNWHHEGHMLTKAIHAPCYRVLQRSNKTSL